MQSASATAVDFYVFSVFLHKLIEMFQELLCSVSWDILTMKLHVEAALLHVLFGLDWKLRCLTDHLFPVSGSHGFSPRPRPFRRQEAVLSPFILKGEMNMITDYDQFCHPIVTKIHIGPIFHETHIFWTFWHKNDIFQTHKSEEN